MSGDEEKPPVGENSSAQSRPDPKEKGSSPEQQPAAEQGTPQSKGLGEKVQDVASGDYRLSDKKGEERGPSEAKTMKGMANHTLDNAQQAVRTNSGPSGTIPGTDGKGQQSPGAQAKPATTQPTSPKDAVAGLPGGTANKAAPHSKEPGRLVDPQGESKPDAQSPAGASQQQGNPRGKSPKVQPAGKPNAAKAGRAAVAAGAAAAGLDPDQVDKSYGKDQKEAAKEKREQPRSKDHRGSLERANDAVTAKTGVNPVEAGKAVPKYGLIANAADVGMQTDRHRVKMQRKVASAAAGGAGLLLIAMLIPMQTAIVSTTSAAAAGNNANLCATTDNDTSSVLDDNNLTTDQQAGTGFAWNQLSDDQKDNAEAIIAKGIEMKLPRRAYVIAIATAMQESGLINLDHGDRDSVGLFQQRTPWGSFATRTNPSKSAELFYNSLKKVKNWETLPLTVAAQAVQISGFPDAYAKHEPNAEDVVTNVMTENGWSEETDFGGSAPPKTVTTNGKVYMVGDSLGVGSMSRDNLKEVEDASSSVSWRVNAKQSRSTDAGIEILKGNDDPDESQTDSYVNTGDMSITPQNAGTWVVELGTNDLGSSARQYKAKINEVMNEAGDKKVVWVNVYKKGMNYKRIGVNKALTKATSKYPSLTVLNWASKANANSTSWFNTDPIHPNADGYANMSGLIGTVNSIAGSKASGDTGATSQSYICNDTNAVTIASCPDSGYNKNGLTPDGILVMDCAKAKWPEIPLIGGQRDEDVSADQDHAEGRAVDIMTNLEGKFAEGSELEMGNEIAQFFMDHNKEFGVHYIVWQDRIWNIERDKIQPPQDWRANGGSIGNSPTVDHFDHVHVSVFGNAATGLQASGEAGADGEISGDWAYPVKPSPTLAGSTYAGHANNARDFGGPKGTPLYAIKAGKVKAIIERKGCDGRNCHGGFYSYGRYITIDHGGGITSLYAHMEKVFVKEGQQVTTGQNVGIMGDLGNTSSCNGFQCGLNGGFNHLHLEILVNGVGQDPVNYLRSRGLTKTVAK